MALRLCGIGRSNQRGKRILPSLDRSSAPTPVGAAKLQQHRGNWASLVDCVSALAQPKDPGIGQSSHLARRSWMVEAYIPSPKPYLSGIPCIVLFPKVGSSDKPNQARRSAVAAWVVRFGGHCRNLPRDHHVWRSISDIILQNSNMQFISLQLTTWLVPSRHVWDLRVFKVGTQCVTDAPWRLNRPGFAGGTNS